MKLLNSVKQRGLIFLAAMAMAVCAPLAAWCVDLQDANPPAQPAAGASSAAAAQLSPPAREVVKMVLSGVSEDVVKAYIQNSAYFFNLTADDIIHLQGIGVSAGVTGAILTHDTALRAGAGSGMAAAPPPAATSGYPQPPAGTVVSPPANVTAPGSDDAVYNNLQPYGSWYDAPGYGWCWQPYSWVGYNAYPWYWLGYGYWWNYPGRGWCWFPHSHFVGFHGAGFVHVGFTGSGFHSATVGTVRFGSATFGTRSGTTFAFRNTSTSAAVFRSPRIATGTSAGFRGFSAGRPASMGGGFHGSMSGGFHASSGGGFHGGGGGGFHGGFGGGHR